MEIVSSCVSLLSDSVVVMWIVYAYAPLLTPRPHFRPFLQSAIPLPSETLMMFPDLAFSGTIDNAMPQRWGIV